MKLGPIRNYLFNAASKTITFLDYTDIELPSILIITNLTSNTIIYNFAIAGKGGNVNGNVLTLTYDTTAMSDTDQLQIYYDDPTRDLVVNDEGELKVISEDNIAMLNRILNSLIPLTNVDSSQRTLQTIDSISAGVTLPTVTTVSTVTAVTGITNPLPAGTNTIGDFTIGASGLGVGYDLYMMTLRSNYNTAILG